MHKGHKGGVSGAVKIFKRFNKLSAFKRRFASTWDYPETRPVPFLPLIVRRLSDRWH
jgi:hypothetical protein